MLNRSIISLTAALLSNSPFSMALSQQKRSLFVLNSHFSNSFTSAFKYSPINSQSVFRRSSFTNMLGGAIRLNHATSYTFSDQEINLRIDLTFTLSELCLVDSCMFRACLATGENRGGALCVTTVEGSAIATGELIVTYSSFYRCETRQQEGGAIYAFLHSITLTQSCFYLCHAETNRIPAEKNSGQAVCLTCGSILDNAMFTLRDCSFVQCPGDKEPHSNIPVLCTFGTHDIDTTNVTDCFCESSSGAFYSLLSRSLFMDYCNFINNTGDNTIALNGIRSSDHIASTNIKDNKLDGNEKCLIYLSPKTSETDVLVFTKFAFVNKPASGTILAFRGESKATVKLDGCFFDGKAEDYELPRTDMNITLSYNGCDFDHPTTNTIKVFNSEECWYVEPPHHAVGSSSYLFIAFYILFLGAMGVGIFFQLKFLSGGMAYSTNIASPIVSSKSAYENIE